MLKWNAVKNHTLTPDQLGSVRGDGARLSSVVLGDRTGGNGHQMKHRRFCLNIRKHFFTVWMTEH